MRTWWWLRRHRRHGALRVELRTLTVAGLCPPSGRGATHWHVWACSCGEELARG